MENYERYKDLEHLLFKGFIPYKLKIGDLNIVFKSINELELETINLMSGLTKNPNYLFNIHINYLFYSIYMIEGTNILANRDKYYSDIYNIFNNLPFKFIKHVFTILEKLSKRAEECSPLIESFSYEAISRYSWKYKKGTLLNDSTHTGILGTNLLGLNEFQKYWIALNIREDQQDSYEEKYNLVKFLASFTNSKAVKQIEDQDKVRKEEEERRKERIRVIGTEEELHYLSGPTETREGIVLELEKQMKGEKDEHDIFIEKYEKDMKIKMLRQMQQMKKMKDARGKQEDRYFEEARPISAEEMAAKMKKMKERKDTNAIIRSYENSEHSSKYFDMSNVDDRDVIRESDFLNEEEFSTLVEDEIFGGTLRPLNSDEKKEAENEYQRQQKSLASKFNNNVENLDFPNLRDK